MAADLLSNLEPLRDIVVPFFDSLPAEGSGLFPENNQPGTDAGCSGIRLQQGGDLGERMAEAFRELFAEGADEVLLIGSDIPQIDSFLIAGYFQALQAYDVVIGPAADGGYYLIGFTRKSFEEDLFERIDWSTERVYRQTLERARKQGLSVHSGRTLRDIDTYEDLESLVNQRNAELYLYDLVRLFLQRRGA
jgi:rSAM/selenodomain-associated transferase 1